jgi:amino acid adenylation domain-containing protein
MNRQSPRTSQNRAPAKPLAVVGMAGRFASAADIGSFKRALQSGESLLSETPAGRFSWLITPMGSMKQLAGGFLSDVAAFDAEAFGIGPRDAPRMDPQLRILLETTLEALQDAGLRPSALRGSQTAVFLANTMNDWANRLRSPAHAGRLRLVDVVSNQLAARLSRNLDLRGSSEVISTACSGGLHAVHRACQALREGECDIALAMGVNVILASDSYIGLARAGMLARGAQAQAFRNDAGGFLRGEGAGVLVLMRTEDAAAGRHEVKALIRGSSVGHSGASGAYDCAEAEIQSRSVTRALRMAGAKPRDFAYIELQAAGNLADEIAEVAVIHEGFRAAATDDADMPARLNAGCLKPLTGHLEAASGIAQIVKAIAVLGSGHAPPLPGLDERPREMAALWPALAFAAAGERLMSAPDQRCALISGLGFGGSHAHVVLDVAKQPPRTAPKPPAPHAFFLSARSIEGLAGLRSRIARFLREAPDLQPDDIAFTLLLGRDAEAERAVFLADSLSELANQLEGGIPAAHGRAADMRLSLGDDKDDRRWLRTSIRNGDWQKLASLWCQGVNFAWDGVAAELPGRRVSLPPAPFSRQAYWLEDATLATAAADTSAPEVNHQQSLASSAAKDRFYRDLFAEIVGETPENAWRDTTTGAELGFDSLAAADLRARVMNWRADTPIPLSDIISAPNLRALIDLMPEPPGRDAVPSHAADEAHRHDPFPVTDIQLAYLIGRESVRDGGGFGCQIYWEFSRPGIDLDRLRRACERLMSRHDMLRAVFLPDATQKVMPPDQAGDAPLSSVDWSQLAPADVEARRNELARQLLSRNFDAARWPLFELVVSRGPEGDRLHFALDLLIADGPSLILMLDDLARYYEGTEPVDPPPAFQFRDYVLATQGENGMARAYWESRLDTLPDAPQLPYQPGKPPSTVVRRLERVLPPAAWSDFQRHAASSGLTVNAALIAAFSGSLAHWSSHSSFCLNVTLAARKPLHPDVSRLVGDFTQNILLAVPERAGDRFADYAQRIAAQLLADCEHGDFSAVSVMRLLSQRHRRPVSMPIVFTSLLGYGGILKRKARIDAMGRYVRGATRTPQVLLDAQVLEAEDGLHISWDVMEGWLAPDLLADMFAGFTACIERLAKEEAAWQEPGRHPAPPPALQRANATAARLPLEPIHAGILRQAEQDPGRVAVVAEDRRLSFGELAGEARCLAQRLIQHGVRHGDLVGVVCPKGWRQIVSVLAACLCGAAYVPVELPMPAERIAKVLARAGTKVVLAHMAPDTTAWPCPVIDDWALDTVAHFAPLPVSATDLAYVIYTSGSTGEPKGVALEHGAVSNTLHSVNDAFTIGSEDCVLGVSSLAFDLSVWDIFGVLGAGGRLVLPAAQSLRDPHYLSELCRREGVTVWNSTPSYLRLVVETPNVVLHPTLRLVMLSGDWIPLELARGLRRQQPQARLVSLGGATEAAIWSIWHEVGEVPAHWRSIPYGKAMPNQRFHILDDALQPVPVGEDGQLHISGTGLARCYWRDAGQTELSFIRHPVTGERLYRTGDFGRLMEDGAIEFLGRRDAQVKIGGHRIELGEIEAAVSRLIPERDITDGVAFTFTDPAGNQRLGLCYRSASGAAEIDVRSALAARLAPYMVPAVILRLNEIPLTDNSKVDRKTLARMALAQSAAPAAMAQSSPPAVSQKLGSLLSDDRLLKSPEDRQAFVAGSMAVRRDLDGAPAVALAGGPVTDEPLRRSTRSFAATALADAHLAGLLSPLREVPDAAGPRRRYASAGSSYAVQAYVILQGQGLSAARRGLWYYDPAQNRLLRTGDFACDLADLHAPANRAMAGSAPVTILLVGDRAAIEPLYGAMSDDMMRIEAGSMAQLLADAAAQMNIGQCTVGWMDIAPLASGLRLSPQHVLLYALLAGHPASTKVQQPAQHSKPPAMPKPSGHALARVRAAWSQVLGHEQFGDDANFFEVGGNSFVAVSLQAQLAGTFTPAPSVTDLFRYPTVRELAAHLEPVFAAVEPAAPQPLPPPELSAAGWRRSRRLDARRNINGRSGWGQQ